MLVLVSSIITDCCGGGVASHGINYWLGESMPSEMLIVDLTT
jgi:hypothetical protein